ncbi:Fuc2NAc and GlcNAc transferase [Pseudomonas protegens]|jgi:Fuc2NAc and GlcNAc transferase|uniref:Glycosyl transferase n=1 Tax=Pseudomonas protegens (strain DSM 19095 / LMG 27888 / CFBP 6595 / CHA0) TaxID=1124983 RepID=A0A2C9ER98_PSEPH|nr:MULTISPECIES: glycosyltransferase family 4 protein [Pseudomonas]AGL86131.1 hypothetical protein PFLCHA0_c43720 [Pseudomonas protegens CHA0]AQT11248.1 glycosyltransferase WbpL [Pseudomonas protegens]MBP5111405.1 glycosyltransferase family 4 protein [Pseudomonas protegens]MCS4262435.1 Fuc2NAc and GlcNAc transferase [Pseudomonas sp. BIGb0176]MDF4208970.1 glycosyltransferase family 4 protein [Pseudomonas protegens]
MSHVYWVMFFSFVGSLMGTAVLRRYALSNSLIDIPNSRSSHTVPTPRGGGVAIVVVFIISAIVLEITSNLQFFTMLALTVTGGMVAVIGFLDDHGHIPARWRLLGHFTAAILGVALLGGMPSMLILNVYVELAWAGHIFAVFYLVWMLNLYNFMDGIDGLAAIEAVFVCLAGAGLYWIVGSYDLAWAPLGLALAVLGFLYWNFPPARIFMGDAGSGFLGLVLGLLALQAAWTNPSLFWSWLIFLGVFIVDATFTLFCRLLRGEKLYEAHRSHAYQFAARRYGRHFPVTLAVLFVNIIWLLPLGFLVGTEKLEGIIGLIIAYVPLILLAVFYKAGAREN